MDLDKLVAKLKKPLRLEDWDISIEKVRPFDMESTGAMGECSADKQEKFALIRVLDESNIPQGISKVDFYRDTVLHEMLHILAHDGDDNKEEVFVRRMTRILGGFLWPKS